MTESSNGRWTFEDPNLELKAGDVIKYYVFVAVNSKGYLSDGLTYTVTGEYFSQGRAQTKIFGTL